MKITTFKSGVIECVEESTPYDNYIVVSQNFLDVSNNMHKIHLCRRYPVQRHRINRYYDKRLQDVSDTHLTKELALARFQKEVSQYFKIITQ